VKIELTLFEQYVILSGRWIVRGVVALCSHSKHRKIVHHLHTQSLQYADTIPALNTHCAGIAFKKHPETHLDIAEEFCYNLSIIHNSNDNCLDGIKRHNGGINGYPSHTIFTA